MSRTWNTRPCWVKSNDPGMPRRLYHSKECVSGEGCSPVEAVERSQTFSREHCAYVLYFRNYYTSLKLWDNRRSTKEDRQIEHRGNRAKARDAMRKIALTRQWESPFGAEVEPPYQDGWLLD